MTMGRKKLASGGVAVYNDIELQSVCLLLQMQLNVVVSALGRIESLAEGNTIAFHCQLSTKPGGFYGTGI